MDIYPYTAKVVILGNTCVGKSCIVHRQSKNQFSVYSEPTIGAAYSTIPISINNNNNTINLQVWDTAGQERYKSLAPMYYRGASAAIIVYDITSRESFEGAKSWISEIKKTSDTNIFFLVGNKCDLYGTRSVNLEEAELYSYTNNIFFTETSARSGYNINNLFKVVGQKLYENYDKNKKESMRIEEFILNDTKDREKKKFSFCSIDFCTII